MIHGFRYHEYGEEDATRIRLIRNFFGLKTVYEVIVLCYFIDRKLSENLGLTWKEITRHFSLDLEACVQLNSTIQDLVAKRLVGYSDGFRHQREEFSLTSGCLSSILNFRKLVSTKKATSFNGFLMEFDSIIGSSDDSFSEDYMLQLCQVVDHHTALPELKWLIQQELSREDCVIFFLTLRDHILFRRSASLEKILKIIADEPFMRFDAEK